MSTAALPSLPGLTWPVVRTPIWRTRSQEAVSGKRINLADWSSPKHRWTVSYNLLRAYSTYAEWQTLEGFFGQLKGGFDSFLYTDPRDNAVVLSTLGVGDSTNRAFQLIRYFGTTLYGYTEPIYAPSTVITSLVVDATTYGSTQYVVQGWGTTAPGLLTFSSFAPTSTQAVKASFSYAWPASFDNDQMSLEEFAKQIWNLKSISWTSLK